MPRKSDAPPKPVARLVWVLGDSVLIDQPGPNSDGAQALIVELQRRKALSELDVAATTTVTSLARAVDSMPGDARLWAQYRQAVEELRGLDRSTEDDDDWTATLGATTVRDAPKPRTRKPRASSRGGGPKAGQGTDAAPAAGVGRRARGGS